MNRRDLFRFATGSVAAFLVGKYGAPRGAPSLVLEKADTCATIIIDRSGHYRFRIEYTATGQAVSDITLAP